MASARKIRETWVRFQRFAEQSDDASRFGGTVIDGQVRPTATVARCRRVSLTVRDGGWAFAEVNARAIDAHWQARSRENPSLFNGRVFIMESGGLAGDRFEAVMKPIEFKAFLYWKEKALERDGFDCFGSALLRSREGHVLLGKSGKHTINAGRIYPPGGFFDERDVHEGAIDLEPSVRREVVEETGLPEELLKPEPHVLVTAMGSQVSLAVEYRLSLGWAEMRALVRDALASQTKPELDDIVIVRSRAELTDASIFPYARVLLEVVLQQ